MSSIDNNARVALLMIVRSSLKCTQLKACCRVLSCKVSGRKAELIGRIERAVTPQFVSARDQARENFRVNQAIRRVLEMIYYANMVPGSRIMKQLQTRMAFGRPSPPKVLKVKVSKWQTRAHKQTGPYALCYCNAATDSLRVSERCHSCHSLRCSSCMHRDGIVTVDGSGYKTRHCLLCRVSATKPLLYIEQHIVRPILLNSFRAINTQRTIVYAERTFHFQLSRTLMKRLRQTTETTEVFVPISVAKNNVGFSMNNADGNALRVVSAPTFYSGLKSRMIDSVTKMAPPKVHPSVGKKYEQTATSTVKKDSSSTGSTNATTTVTSNVTCSSTSSSSFENVSAKRYALGLYMVCFRALPNGSFDVWWPINSELRINNNAAKFGHQRFDGLWFDASNFVKEGSNEVKLRFSHHSEVVRHNIGFFPIAESDVKNLGFSKRNIANFPCYFFMFLASQRPTDGFIKSLVQDKNNLIPYISGKNAIINSFQSSSSPRSRSNSDGFECLETERRLSVRDPLSLCIMSGEDTGEYPARGINCKHLQCFGLKTFFQFNRQKVYVHKNEDLDAKKKKTKWRCPHCDILIKPNEIRIDSFLLEAFGNAAKKNSDVEYIRIQPDGTWLQQSGEDGKISKSNTEDDKNADKNEMAPSTSNFIDLLSDSEDDENMPETRDDLEQAAVALAEAEAKLAEFLKATTTSLNENTPTTSNERTSTLNESATTTSSINEATSSSQGTRTMPRYSIKDMKFCLNAKNIDVSTVVEHSHLTSLFLKHVSVDEVHTLLSSADERPKKRARLNSGEKTSSTISDFDKRRIEFYKKKADLERQKSGNLNQVQNSQNGSSYNDAIELD
eukprot:g3454.t1